jgi:tetratricopeptide (TPR) repeat protein
MRNSTIILALTVVLLGVSPFGKRKEPLPHGKAALADGSFPELLVTIERVCKGKAEFAGFTGSQGRFSIEDSESTGCEVRAYLPGYRSQTVPLKGENLGTLILRPRGKSDTPARSTKNKEFNKNAWKAYELGLDEAAKGNWHAAEYDFHETLRFFVWASPAWLSLGQVQEREGDKPGAVYSYRQAIAIDDGFVLPYVYIAALEADRGDWQATLNDSAKAITLDAESFPGLWFANAWANLNMHQLDAAEKSARQGIALDTDHRFPELEYVLGLVLLDKVDRPGAVEHLKAYLALEPQGARAAAARSLIE